MEVVEKDLHELLHRVAMLEERVENIERLLTKEDDE